MSLPQTILITTLAEYQTRFWIPVAQRLQRAGRDVQLLAFDDRSAEMAEAQGVAVVNMYRSGLEPLEWVMTVKLVMPLAFTHGTIWSTMEPQLHWL